MTHKSITITSAAQLVAAIPAMLGYVPASGSLIVVAFTADNSVEFVTRGDVVDAVGIAHYLVENALRYNDAHSVVVVTVAEPSAKSHAAIEHLCAVDFLAKHVAVVGSYYVPDLAVPSRSQDLDTLEMFDVDPTSSVLAAARVAAGRPLERTRDAIADRYTRAEAITPAAEADSAKSLEELAATIAARELPSRALIADAAALIVSIPFRDAMFRLPTYGDDAASTVFTTLARHTRGTARVHALCLVGWHAHTVGEGVAASVAYDAADAEIGERECQLLTLLRTALDSGAPPAFMRQLVPSEEEVRETTGANLPGQD